MNKYVYIILMSFVLKLLILFQNILIFFLKIFQLTFFKKRNVFESKNIVDPYSESFSKSQLKACACFHFSSEGEFEQIRPLIDKFLDQGERVELIYTSPSVEASVSALIRQYDLSQVRALRLPLTYSLSLKEWVTSKSFFMVRYDFFPSLLILGLGMKSFTLYSCTLKSSSSFSNFIKQRVLNLFTDIYPATEYDANQLKELNTSAQVHEVVDFRTLQIFKRQNTPEKKKRDFFKSLSPLFTSFPIDNRFLFSQCWDYEKELFIKYFSDKDAEFFNNHLIYIAPHLLSEENRANFISFLNDSLSHLPDISVYVIEKNAELSQVENTVREFINSPGIILSFYPGVLCELYPYFSYAYIGGGFGKGLHSVLEPFIGNVSLYIGPNVDRSTEYLTLKEHRWPMKIINSTDELIDFNINYKVDLDISSFIEHNKTMLNKIYQKVKIENA